MSEARSAYLQWIQLFFAEIGHLALFFLVCENSKFVVFHNEKEVLYILNCLMTDVFCVHYTALCHALRPLGAVLFVLQETIWNNSCTNSIKYMFSQKPSSRSVAKNDFLLKEDTLSLKTGHIHCCGNLISLFHFTLLYCREHKYKSDLT